MGADERGSVGGREVGAMGLDDEGSVAADGGGLVCPDQGGPVGLDHGRTVCPDGKGNRAGMQLWTESTSYRLPLIASCFEDQVYRCCFSHSCFVICQIYQQILEHEH